MAVACLLAVPPARSQAPGIELQEIFLERSESGWLLTAGIRVELPSIVEDALHKGIPMFFVTEVELTRERWYWYDRRLAQGSRYHRLAYQPLTRRWRVTTAGEPIGAAGGGVGFTQSFDSLPEAMRTIQRISRWKVAELGDIDPEARQNLAFRFRLDLSQLPRPFQIGAAGHADWNLTVSRNLRLPPEGGR